MARISPGTFRMFHGSIVALVTPIDERGDIDLSAFDRLIEFHLDRGTDGLVVAGTTGESATLSPEEFRRLLERAVMRVDGAIPVLAGTGGPDTRKAVKQTRLAADIGADAALVVTPYYNRPTQAGLEAHYRAISDVTKLPLVLYNVPARTGVDLLPDTVERLAAVANVVAVKEAVSDMDRVDDLVARCGARLVVLSGDDPTCCEAMRRGARGVISVAANVVPGRMARLSRLAAAADPAAAPADAALRQLFATLALESNPIPVKWSLYRMGLIGDGIRLPLQPLAERHRPALEAALEQLGIALVANEEQAKA